MGSAYAITTRARVGFLAVISAMAIAELSLAIPASPHPFTVTQPDGSMITLRVRGDEYFNWWEDLAGYTVVRDGNHYVYAQTDARGELAPTQWEVGKTDPAARDLAKRVLPAPEVRARIRASRSSSGDEGNNARGIPRAAGTLKNIVILLQFSDHAARPIPSQADYDSIFNATIPFPPAAPTGSVRSVYLEDSYGQLEINSTVFGWYLLPGTEAFYAHGTSGLGQPKTYILDALDLADADIDFSQFDEDGDGFVDGIAFIHSGYGAEFGGTDTDGAAQADRIWSHRSNVPEWTSAEGVKVRPYHISSGLWGLAGSDPGRIGVIAHESGHFFGVPDLYDTSGTGEGIGSWGMMANSWGFDGSQYFPPHFCAWSKIRLGWLTPTIIDTPGEYTAVQVESIPDVYRIDVGYPPDEYLLIENRQPFGHEADIPQGGLAIFHIDDTAAYSDEGYPGQAGWPENGNHYRVALLQADGAYHLEREVNRGDTGDAYHGGAGGVSDISGTTVPNTDAYQGGNVVGTGNSIWGISASGPVMTFNFGFGEPLPAPWPHDSPKNRYISFAPNNSGTSVAFQVEMVAGLGATGVVGWVGEPVDMTGTGEWVSQVVTDPIMRPWPEETLHIGDCEIVPTATYQIRATADLSFFGFALEVATIHKPGTKNYGDTVGVGTGDLLPLQGFEPPNGVVNVTDVQAFLLTLQGPSSPSAPTTWVDLHGLGQGSPPNFILNVADLQRILFGLDGLEYTDTPEQLLPENCP